MAIFTSAIIATFIGVEAGLFTTAAAFVLNAGVGIAASLGLSYAAKALSGNQASSASASADHFGIQGSLQAGGDIPRSFGLGRHVTAGSLAYANTYGGDTQTPNAYLAQVIVVSDLPGETLEEIWINGEKVTLDLGVTQDVGNPVIEYRKDGADHLYVKYYDGTQTTADAHLVSEVASDDRPYPSTRVGKGLCYVIVTSLVEDTLFNGFPDCKFVLSGIPLYDPSKDSSVGGSGSHRYDNPATWGGDGNDLPVVQAYNVLRGIYYSGTWFYGLQGMTEARLPASNWIAQIGKCRATVTGVDGPEATYRSGGQVNVDTQSANLIEALFTTCQGRLCEVGGSYKTYVGEPESPSFSFADGQVLSSEPQTFKPFFALSSSVNGIQGKYPDPAQGWNMATAPALYRTDLEARDGNRRLMASPSFDFAPYAEQVQRLQKSAIREAQRARTHVIVLPPWAWPLEPGDVVEWTSARNGYATKSFRVDSVIDRANLDVTLNITEVDPSDYDWNHATEYSAGTVGPTIFSRPAPQDIIDFDVQPYALLDSDNITRRPAIRLTWDGDMPGVVGVQYEVRLASNSSDVTRGRTDQVSAAALIVSHNLIPNTEYEVRAQYLPSSPRDMLWSDWLSVTTPAIYIEIADVGPAIEYILTTLDEQFNDKLEEFNQKYATLTSRTAALRSLAENSIRDQVWIRTESIRTELALGDDALGTRIDHVSTVSTNADATLAQDILTVRAWLGEGFSETNTVHKAFVDRDQSVAETIESVSAKFGTGFTDVNTVSAAFATRDETFGQYQTDIAATFGAGFSKFSSIATAFSGRDLAFSDYKDEVSATFGSSFSSVHSVSSAISTLDGYASSRYSVELDTNGYATGFTLFNGGSGVSSTTFVQDKFQIAFPGHSGGDPVPVFTVGLVNGAAKIGIRGDMFVDGDIIARMIAANNIQAQHMSANSVTANNAAISYLAVKSLNIQDAAVTVPKFSQLVSVAFGKGLLTESDVLSSTIVVDTTGLDGKTIVVYSNAFFQPSWTVGDTSGMVFRLYINNSMIADFSSPPPLPYGVLTGGKEFLVAVGQTTLSVTTVLRFVGQGTGTGGPTTNTVFNSNIFTVACKR